jgi:tetratricopeptide (TPR) repeat protein
MKQVKVWAEDVLVPTYLPGEPDKNPIFLEKRVYQGSSGKVYPHSVIDSVADEKALKTYRAVYLENEFLKIMVLPELGGRIQRATDKTNGYDFVYYNQVIKPALVGLAGPWISGGIEFNWPQHHRPSTFDPVSWRIAENQDGSCSVIVGEIENMFRTKGITRFTLFPGKAYLELSTQLYNRMDTPQTFLWWANPAVAVNNDTQSIFPPDVHAVMDHGKRDVSAFPIAKGVYYKVDYAPGTDISRYRNIPVPTSYMAFHSDYDFVGNYDYGRNAGLLHVADHHISPGKKQWTWGNGAFGRAWDRNLTDEDGPYIELMTGCFTDNQPDFSWLMPYEEKSFTQYFMPYKGVGMVKNATRDAAVRLEWANGRASIAVYATGVQEDALIQVKAGESVIFEKAVTLTPREAFDAVFDAASEELTLTVRAKTGRILASYDLKPKKEEPLPSPAQAIPPAIEAATNEELFLYGQHIEQYRHATWDAAEYYLEGLKRDPTDARINNAYGKLLLKRGLIEESVPYFKAGIQKMTMKNPNPYDGEPNFNLGVALSFLDKWDEAYNAFFKSTWNAAWQNAGYYRVAAIDLRRGEYELAIEHLQKALIRNSHHMKARNAMAAALRRLHRLEEAKKTAEESLCIDPMDLIAMRECVLLGGGSGDVWLDMPGINHNTAIELSLEYAEWGMAEDAMEILKAYAARIGDPVQVYPLIYYHLGALNGDDRWFSFAEDASSDYCFPHRLEDRIVLERAIHRNVPHSKALYYLGNFWYDRLQAERAIACWEESIRLEADFAIPHRNLALAYFNKRAMYKEALSEMETAFALNDSDARIFMELDQLRKKLKVPASERLEHMDCHWPLVAARDDQYLEYCTVLNKLGEYEKALTLLLARRFHPWEGGEGKVPAQWRIAMTQLAHGELQRKEYGAVINRLQNVAGDYPESFGEGKLTGAQENDTYYLLGKAYAASGDIKAAHAAYERAGSGLSTPAGMMYYNDQPPEMIFYQGLARRELGDVQGASVRFDKLITYGREHMDDEVKIEFFAVSLPDLQIFEEDLQKRNRVHCLFMMALGHLGKGEREEADALLRRLYELEPEHQGAKVHIARFLEK